MIILKRKIYYLAECADLCTYQSALSYAIASDGETEQRREARKEPIQRLCLSRAQVNDDFANALDTFSNKSLESPGKSNKRVKQALILR